MNELNESICKIESFIRNPQRGLPEEVFLFLSRNTPMINTDLLIKNDRGQTLLTWRDDGYAPAGWHIPGGIIRYKESFADRISATAKTEIGADVKFKPVPLAFNEFIASQSKDRGHFISLLFSCVLVGHPDRNIEYKGGQPRPGEWKWHSRCPENMLSGQAAIYKEFINSYSSDSLYQRHMP